MSLMQRISRRWPHLPATGGAPTLIMKMMMWRDDGALKRSTSPAWETEPNQCLKCFNRSWLWSSVSLVINADKSGFWLSDGTSKELLKCVCDHVYPRGRSTKLLSVNNSCTGAPLVYKKATKTLRCVSTNHTQQHHVTISTKKPTKKNFPTLFEWFWEWKSFKMCHKYLNLQF